MTTGSQAIAQALEALIAADGRLAPIAAEAGPLPERAGAPGLRGLVSVVMGQQVSRASAAAIFARLTALVDLDDPLAILDAGDETFRRAGLSRPKERTLIALARAAVDGRLDLAGIAAMEAQAAIAELVAIPGIGPWTAECFLLFSAGHPDIFPAGDLALRVAVGDALLQGERPTARTVAALALGWSPRRSVAARLFWAHYARITHRNATPSAIARA